ncbi:MAG: FHA domain-containing protein [Polyangiaceae bacterium]
MGVLEGPDGARHTLSARCIVGRDPRCDLCVKSGLCSSEHASLHWMGDRWEVRDLDSRNGTWVGDVRLGHGERRRLVPGDTLAFGDMGRRFTLVDASEPRVTARRIGTSIERVAEGRLLVLPGEDQPLTTIFEEGGVWVAESDAEKHPVTDNERLIVSGEEWLLSLPRIADVTWEAGAAQPTLGSIKLRLAVSLDEEHVEVTIFHGGRVTTLPPRTGHYVLVLLSRARLGDAESSPAERGWVLRDTLCRDMRIDQNRLNVEVWRLRKQLSEIPVSGISGLVERRPQGALLRLAIDQVEIVRL